MVNLTLQFPKRGRKDRKSSTPEVVSATATTAPDPLPPVPPINFQQRSSSVPALARPGTALSTADVENDLRALRGTPPIRPFSAAPAASEPGSPRSFSMNIPSLPSPGLRPGSRDTNSFDPRNRISSVTIGSTFSHQGPRNQDDFVMDTNNSSIVSKRSVERLYHAGEPEFFRHFVSKFKRRSPLINRGYWLRMKAVEYAVTRFLTEQTPKTKLVVNLGCGYDPLPFQFLGKQRELCENTLFVDVDFPALMQNKVSVISKTEQLNSLIPDVAYTGEESGLLATSLSYAAVGCDLRNLDTLRAIMQEHFQVETSPVSIMFVAEVSIAYMDPISSQAVLEWAATYDDVRFTMLEQHVPDGLDHPFALTMLSHFNKLRTPLHTLGSMEQMKARFHSAGWPERTLEAHSLWELWAEPAFVSAETRRSLDTIEPFDEWEEFALFASHYFLLVAERKADQDYSYRAPRSSLVSSRMSMLPAPSTPQTPELSDSDPANVLVAQELPTTHVPRRFAALTPSPSRAHDGDALGLHGGLGIQERRDDCDTYSWFDTAPRIDGPPLRAGIMCHTVTRLGGTNNCMLVGGRTAPDKALDDCWLRQEGVWQKVASLPEGRYRHCAVPVRLPTEPRPAHTLLIYGGKTSEGHVLDEWLLWTGDQGWQSLRVVGDHPCARFGAAMITDKAEGISGIIVGGLTSAGRVLADFWHWNLQPDMSITCQNVTARASGVLKNNSWVLGRFGAQLVRSEQGILLVGGVAGSRMLTRNDQMLNMRTLRTTPVRGARQLYVGCSVQNVDGGILILGGGATCFSFGTFWNKSCLLTQPGQRRDDMSWQLVSETTATSVAEPKTLIVPPSAYVPSNDIPKNAKVNGPPRSVTLPLIDTGESFTAQSPVELGNNSASSSAAPSTFASSNVTRVSTLLRDGESMGSLVASPVSAESRNTTAIRSSSIPVVVEPGQTLKVTNDSAMPVVFKPDQVLPSSDVLASPPSTIKSNPASPPPASRAVSRTSTPPASRASLTSTPPVSKGSGTSTPPASKSSHAPSSSDSTASMASRRSRTQSVIDSPKRGQRTSTSERSRLTKAPPQVESGTPAILKPNMGLPPINTGAPFALESTEPFPAINGHQSTLPPPLPVARVHLDQRNPFEKVMEGGRPVIIKGSFFGRCTQYWTDEYLKEAVGKTREVVVHEAPEERMDFAKRNFNYVKRQFGSFIDGAARGERVYLRSLSREQPSKTAANLTEDFPELARDFQLPVELTYVMANAHSTPLRISGPVSMWLHYDVMDNVLCQVRGLKRMLLFPPSDVNRLGFAAGASSSSLDVIGIAKGSGGASAPSLAQTQPYEAVLGPGDALFIPATWAHASAAPSAGTLSVAVNCFFRGMAPQAYAAGRDVYGNRDVAAYERGRRDIGRIAASFNELPPSVAAFYLERLAMELLARSRTIAAAGGSQIHATHAELDS